MNGSARTALPLLRASLCAPFSPIRPGGEGGLPSFHLLSLPGPLMKGKL